MKTYKCIHTMKIVQKSNILQQDSMGYPLRLCIVECTKCGESYQMWMDVSEDELKELETGESVLLEWKNV